MDDGAWEAGLQRLMATLGLPPAARPQVLKALTHRSSLRPGQPRWQANESLEFLGDAVLDLSIADLALAVAPQAPEGTLSQARAALVNGEALATQARLLGLGPLLILGAGELRSGGQDKTSILAAAFEALMGVLYRQVGLPATRQFVSRLLGAQMRDWLQRLPQEDFDPKSTLQERLQAGGAAAPEYRMIASSGPSHHRHFTVQVWHEEVLLAQGEGESKKQAEREAARQALERCG